MIKRISNDVYEFVQPDASVIGGISAVMAIFEAANAHQTEVVVHAWGGAAAVMANYHAAFAGGGKLVEYPMLDFPLSRDLSGDQAKISEGRLQRPEGSGIGISLTPEIESKYPFDETAVYSCMRIDGSSTPDSYWQ